MGYSIVQDAFSRSLLENYSMNYAKLKSANDDFLDTITKRFFIGSSILTDKDDVKRIILYLNLPFQTIINRKLVPVCLKKTGSINEMIEVFEQSEYNKAPNVILFKNGAEIFGGYASDSWSV